MNGPHKYKGLLITILMVSLFHSGCSSSSEKENRPKNDRNSIPEEFQKDGMISSSTYQVFVRTYGETEEEAKVNGEAAAREKAFKYIIKEPFIRTRLSEYGSGLLKNIIKKNGKIVRIAMDSERTWSISYHISKIGLREDFQKLR